MCARARRSSCPSLPHPTPPCATPTIPDPWCERAGTDETTIEAFRREIEMLMVVGKHPSVVEIVGECACSSLDPKPSSPCSSGAGGAPGLLELRG